MHDLQTFLFLKQLKLISALLNYRG